MGTYSFAVTGQTPAATPTDVFAIAGKNGGIIEIRYVVVSGVAASAGQMTPTLIRRSGQNTGGSPATQVESKHDPYDPPSGATLTLFAANPSPLATTVHTFKSRRLAMLTNIVTPDRIEWNFIRDKASPLRLIGPSDILVLNFGGAAVPLSGAFDLELEWVTR